MEAGLPTTRIEWANLLVRSKPPVSNMARIHFRIGLPVFAFFALIALVLFYPILHNTFLSDDYDSLYRIAVERRILFREYFRPMIDISFYLNYLLSGLRPGSYYVFNLTVHVINVYLIFRLSLRMKLFDPREQEQFAFLSGMLFLIYPFHNEAVAWLSGRLSSMACLFALITLVLVTQDKLPRQGRLLAAICFLLGLLCYESILLLPLVAEALQWHRGKAVNKIIRSLGLWTGVVAFYLLCRYFFSGVIFGDYGGRLVSLHPSAHGLSKYVKVLGRLLLPGTEHSGLLVVLVSVIGLLLLVLHLLASRIGGLKQLRSTGYAKLVLALVLSLLIPMAFGVSTRTSEGDRLLYFPSCFLCMLLAFMVLYLFRHPWPRRLALLLVSGYFVFFLETNNRRWIEASRASEEILRTVKQSEARQICLINLPDELEGAFVFRNGFYKSLVINRVDTSKVIVANYLGRLDYLRVQGAIEPSPAVGDSIFIYPRTRIIQNNGGTTLVIASTPDSSWSLVRRESEVYFWNKERLVRLY
jgi:protein O-mannosyl-transferase